MQFPHAGQMFQGKYELLEVLGRGGFAAVYKAIDQDVGRAVAIKVLMPSDAGYDSSIVARFEREARIIAQLKDPHTITMFDFGRTADGLLYMVFEYVAGADLSNRLEETGPLPAPVVMHVLDQLLQALREAHEAGVLHRDIKPANILVFPYLDDEWQVKLLDFGIAKPGIGKNADPVATLTQAGGVIGTPRYMSPEQLCGESLRATTDIYSLGLLAFEMLVGTPAIGGRDTRDNIVLQLSTDPLILPDSLPIPAQFRRLVERMMARDAEDRFQSAREVLVMLRSAGASASGPHTGPQGAVTAPTHVGSGPLRKPPGSGPHHPPDSGPQTHLRLTPESLPGLSAPSSSAELVQDPKTSPDPAPPSKPRLPPAALIGLGIALGAAIVIPITLLVMRKGDPDPGAPTINRALTKTQRPNPLAEQPEPTIPEDPEPAVPEPDVNATDTPDRGCGAPLERGGFVTTISDAGLTDRGFITYVPHNYDRDRRHPLVMVFHDRTRDPRLAISDMKLQQLADNNELLVVAPAGRDDNTPWAPAFLPAADIDFINDILRQVKQRYCVDERFLYGIAHNTSAGALEGFACSIPFSAIATTAYRGPAELPCDYSPAVPHIHLVGQRDQYHPLKGGSTCDLRTIPALSVKEELWKKQNKCSGKRRSYVDLPTGVCETFDDCDAAFVSCILDGGRDWPDSAPRDIQLPSCIQRPSEFPITQTVWDFFKKHGHPLHTAE